MLDSLTLEDASFVVEVGHSIQSSKLPFTERAASVAESARILRSAASQDAVTHDPAFTPQSRHVSALSKCLGSEGISTRKAPVWLGLISFVLWHSSIKPTSFSAAVRMAMQRSQSGRDPATLFHRLTLFASCILSIDLATSNGVRP